MKTKRAPRRKGRQRKPINAGGSTVINYDAVEPPAAPPRSRERRFYDNLLLLGVTFRVEGGRVVGTMPSGAACIYPLADEIAKRESAIMRFIFEVN